MTETKMDYSIGHLRIKYLDLANIAFAQNNYIGANGYIDSFLDTIKEETNSGQTIKKEFDKIILMKRQRLADLTESVKELGYLEKKDVENGGKEEIEINTIHDKKEVCWRIAMKEGLFNE